MKLYFLINKEMALLNMKLISYLVKRISKHCYEFVSQYFIKPTISPSVTL